MINSNFSHCRLSLDLPKDESLSSDKDLYLSALSSTSDMSSNPPWTITPRTTSADPKELNGISLTSTPIHKASSESSSRDSSPGRLSRKNDLNILKYDEMSPIGKASAFAQKLITPPGVSRLSDQLAPGDAIVELKQLVDQINEQKAIVLESLENDCDKEELNCHMAVSFL